MNRRLLHACVPLLLVLFSASLRATELQGRIERGEAVTLSTNLAAQVLRVDVRPGQRVKKGASLLQLEEVVPLARLEQTRAEVAHHKLLRAEAQSELQRSEELYERTLLSDHDLDVARIAASAAEAGYQRALAGLKEAQRVLALSRIVAPFDALVIELHAQAGETVNGQYRAVPLVSVVDSSIYRVRLELGPEQMTSSIAVGSPIEVEVGKRRIRGEVGAITFYREKAFAERAMLDLLLSPVGDGALSIGDTVRVTLP